MKSRLFFRKAVWVVSSLFFLISCSSEGEKKDLKLFHGGTVLTMDKDFSEVEAVVIENNMIIATGTFEDLNENYGERSELIDLNGRTMLPGFYSKD